MRFHSTALLLLFSTALASPSPRPQGKGTGADSCASEPLTQDTWNKLKLDEFITSLSKNFTGSKKNVQGLAASFGAPNFFCGLDNFCNAGQPCLPIQLPQWYIAVSMQNWNNYVNSLNTAINFAASIISLKLPDIVKDVYPDPKDDITPLKNLGTMFGTVLGFIPFTGAIATGVAGVQTGLNFVLTQAKPPAPTDKFLAWSNVASSTADMVSQYQSVVSNLITQTLDSDFDDLNIGIRRAIRGGSFMGDSRNVTQDALQKQTVDIITMNALSLALQAQKFFVSKFTTSSGNCAEESAALLCIDDGSSAVQYSLLRADGDDNAVLEIDMAQKLVDNYGLTKESMLKGPADCLDKNNGKQLVTPLDQGIAADARAPCMFMLLVCARTPAAPGEDIGIVPRCRQQGVPV